MTHLAAFLVMALTAVLCFGMGWFLGHDRGVNDERERTFRLLHGAGLDRAYLSALARMHDREDA